MTVLDTVHASTSDPAVDAVFGENTAQGARGRGLHGRSPDGAGVFGESTNFIGVAGESTVFDGVFGTSHHSPGAGVSGHNDASGGVGVYGESIVPGAASGSANGNGDGVESQGFDGGFFVSHHNGPGAGVSGHNDAGGPGVFGESLTVGAGFGAGNGTGDGVVGVSGSGRGVIGVSNLFVGVWAESKDRTRAGLFATNNQGAGLAARFEGNVEVTGDIKLTGQDLAENFEISTGVVIAPGTLVVISDDGRLRESDQPYDKKVAGVVSGAGDFTPAIILGKYESEREGVPVALFGRAFCKVDAEYSPIETGDLLTASPTPGHAMKVIDPTRAFGAVIGKALCPLENGRGLIPILIALQ